MTSTELPLVLPCRGGTATTQLAAEVAAALDRLGVAEATSDAAQAVAAARRGRRVVALDGCASACRARLLEAQGVGVEPGLNLAELGVDVEAAAEADVRRLAAEAAARLGRHDRPSTRSGQHRRRLVHPPVARRSTRAHDVNDYLLAIDALASTSVECGAVAADAPTLAAHVSLLLGVSRPSAGEALARLQARGLVTRGAQKQVVLTPRGRDAADRIVRRHRLLERFAVDYLGYPSGECFERARILERAFDDDAIERLHDKLGSPERCPHGWPVDPRRARAEGDELCTLLALPEGARATVARIVERDGALTLRLFELGLVPGVDVAVEQRRSDPLGLSVRIAGALRDVDIDAGAAAATLVHASHGN